MGFVKSRNGGGLVTKRNSRHSTSSATASAANLNPLSIVNSLPPTYPNAEPRLQSTTIPFDSSIPLLGVSVSDQFHQFRSANEYEQNNFGHGLNGFSEPATSQFSFVPQNQIATSIPADESNETSFGIRQTFNGQMDQIPSFDFDNNLCVNNGNEYVNTQSVNPAGTSVSSMSNAVAAASFLLAANCYDGVLLPSAANSSGQTAQAAAVAHFGGLENVPQNPAAYVAAAANFYGVSDQCGLLPAFPTDQMANCSTQPLAVSAATNCCPSLTSMNFSLGSDQSNVIDRPLNDMQLLDAQQTQFIGQNNNNYKEPTDLNESALNTGMLMTQQPQQLESQQPVSVQSKLTAQSTSQTQKCATCNSQIQDRYLMCVNGLYYHADCLRCSVCSIQLENEPTCFCKQSGLYCKSCYVQKFQTKCAHCDRQIQPNDWVRRARSFVYHLACFSCNHCKRQLVTGEQFSLQETKLLCKQHYLELVQGEDANQKHKIKRVRTTFAEDQLSILQAHFQRDSNPDGSDLERIANQTGLSKRVTQVWFQNSRARQKKYQVGGKKISSQNVNGHPGSNSGLSTSPTTTIDSTLSPMTKSPSSEQHALLLTADHLSSTAAAIDDDSFAGRPH
ncbi:LIM/homeobox protein Awh [Aphelenchoides besseyi]|nr:LIM/homeobox protein Awh [Aphelenchoides besseyi]KAI6211865.1 LIM/homeobox protein Awh [Aphelenchoides besseyi]